MEDFKGVKGFFTVHPDKIDLGATGVHLLSNHRNRLAEVSEKEILWNFRFNIDSVLLDEPGQNGRRAGGVTVSVGADVIGDLPDCQTCGINTDEGKSRPSLRIKRKSGLFFDRVVFELTKGPVFSK